MTGVTSQPEESPLCGESESSPLLPKGSGKRRFGDVEDNECLEDDGKTEDNNIPKMQVALLCYARMMEAIAYFLVFPFINEMIFRMPGVERTSTGFYSGLVESLFALTQMISMPFWSKSIRRFGRRPAIIISLFGMAGTTCLFGFSQKIWHMILCRCLAGVFSGSAVGIRLMFYEISTPKTEARVFSFFPLANNFGMFFGPFIGGFLADPTQQYPSVFGSSQIFKDYPYALATLGGGGLIATSAITTLLFVHKTTPRLKDLKDEPKLTLLEILKCPGVLSALFLWLMTLFIALGFTAVLPTFWFTHISQGGLSFPPSKISLFLALIGTAQALWTLLIYPPLESRLGRLPLIRLCYLLWPAYFLLGPALNQLLRTHHRALFWTLACAGYALGNAVSMAFSAAQLVVNDVAPSREALETLNALALALLSAARATAPAACGSLYALGVGRGWMGGQLVWAWFVLLWVLPAGVLKFFPPVKRVEG